MITTQDIPWLDILLDKNVMDHLWDIINTTQQKDSKGTLAGNISKSMYIQDKENYFFNEALKECSEHLYYKDWNNYYDVVITKAKPPPIFALESIWVNYQKQYEFNPKHSHSGLFSFVVFMKIPTHWKEQHALPFSASSNSPVASDFQFLFGHGEQRPVDSIPIPLCPEDEGKILFFPAWLSHEVFPFYGTEEERITISGNIVRNDASQGSLEEKEQILEKMEKQQKSERGVLEALREVIKQERKRNND